MTVLPEFSTQLSTGTGAVVARNGNDMATTEIGQLSGHDMRRVAVEAVCHDRSVKRYLEGKQTGDMTRLRIEAALRKLGFNGSVRQAVAS